MKELSKKNLCIIWAIVSILLGVIYEVVCSKMQVYPKFSIDRIFIVFLIAMFAGMHIIFGIKKLYNFIIEKRYIIAGICLVVFTVLGYTGSSIGALSSWILEDDANNTILGTYRFIRSDEYGIEALMSASQKTNRNEAN